MPSPPGGGGGGGEPKPQQSPQPNNPFSTSTPLIARGVEGLTSNAISADRSGWQQYTTSNEIRSFSTGIDTVAARQAAQQTQEEQSVQEQKPVLNDFSSQSELKSVDIDQREEPAPKKEKEERFENPPRDNATGFTSPEERKTAAENLQKEYPQPSSGPKLDTEPTRPQENQTVAAVLMTKLRDLLQKLLNLLTRRKEEPQLQAAPIALPRDQEIGRIPIAPISEKIDELRRRTNETDRELFITYACGYTGCVTKAKEGDPVSVTYLPAIDASDLLRLLDEQGWKMKYPVIAYEIHTHPDFDKPPTGETFGPLGSKWPAVNPTRQLTGFSDGDILAGDGLRKRYEDYLSFGSAQDPDVLSVRIVVESGGIWLSDGRRAPQRSEALLKELFNSPDSASSRPQREAELRKRLGIDETVNYFSEAQRQMMASVTGISTVSLPDAVKNYQYAAALMFGEYIDFVPFGAEATLNDHIRSLIRTQSR